MRSIWLVAILILVSCSPENEEQNWQSNFTKPVLPADQGSQEDSISTGTTPPVISNTFDPSQGRPSGAPINTGVSYLVDAGITETDSDEEETCGSVKLDVEYETVLNPGNILVIFDRSQSMAEAWGSSNRYESAGNALIAAITPLKDVLTVGGQFFPSLSSGEGDANAPTCNIADPFDWIPGMPGDCLNPDVLMSGLGSCEVSPITADDQLNFRPAEQFIADLPTYWSLPGQGMGMTPLEMGVTQADAALASTTFYGPVFVIIMTDGVPNCSTNQDNVLAIVANWASQGVLTYVIGLPGSNEAASFLSTIATTGGSERFIEPTDPAILETELTDILTEVVKAGLKNCTINLNQEEEADFEKLQLVVDDGTGLKNVPKQLASGLGGWSMSADGLTATLEGVVCEDAMAGNFDTIEFTFGCNDLPTLN